jgi:hypothetical protein
MGAAVRANRAFHLIVSREGLEPAFLADPDRLDRIELISIDDGEVVLFLDLPPRDASKVVRELREDLAGMEADEFYEKWAGADAEG